MTVSTLQKLYNWIEGEKGLSNNPDFFIEIRKSMKYNHFAKDVSNEALTQIVWEAKDKILSTVQEKIKEMEK